LTSFIKGLDNIVYSTNAKTYITDKIKTAVLWKFRSSEFLHCVC